MEEYYFGVPISNSRTLCIGPITNEEARQLDEAQGCDGRGYYLYVANAEAPRSEISVLAKIVSERAAQELAGLLRNRVGLAASF